MNILLPVDGSAQALRAAYHVIAMLQGCGTHRVHLVNAQPPIDVPEVRSHMTAPEIEAMQQTRGGDAMAETRAVLDKAGITYTPAVLLGPVAESLAQYAIDHQCEQIVMGARGLGALSGMLMGSVSTRLLHLTSIPLTLVK